MRESELRSLLTLCKSIRILQDEKYGLCGRLVDLTSLNLGLDIYPAKHVMRFAMGIETLAHWISLRGVRSPKILEVGAFPFFFTGILLSNIEGCSIVALEEPREKLPGSVRIHPGEAPKRVSLAIDHSGQQYVVPIYTANVERDELPFDDATFDIVVFTEVIEHLVFNPTHALCELHRVLIPGGAIYVTTPNSTRFDNMLNLLLNRSIYHRFAGNGVYGRHNFEWTLSELRLLLEQIGYDVMIARHVNCYFHPLDPHRGNWTPNWRVLYFLNRLFTSLPVGYCAAKRENIEVLAVKKGHRCIRAYPKELYFFNELYKIQ